jgi:hypothetical protein
MEVTYLQLVTEVLLPAGLGFFSLATASIQALGTAQPPVQCVREIVSLDVQRSERKADHSPLPSAEVKNARSRNSIPPIRLHTVVLN